MLSPPCTAVLFSISSPTKTHFLLLSSSPFSSLPLCTALRFPDLFLHVVWMRCLMRWRALRVSPSGFRCSSIVRRCYLWRQDAMSTEKRLHVVCKDGKRFHHVSSLSSICSVRWLWPLCIRCAKCVFDWQCSFTMLAITVGLSFCFNKCVCSMSKSLDIFMLSRLRVYIWSPFVSHSSCLTTAGIVFFTEK